MKHTYWDTDKNWCGKTIDEWNAMTYEERRSYLHPADLQIFEPRYLEWMNDENQTHLKARFRIKNEIGEYILIESRFFKDAPYPEELPTIIQLSWKVEGKKEK